METSVQQEEEKDKQWITSSKTSVEGAPGASLLYATGILHGKSQYLGGRQGDNGKIYCVPGHASHVLVIDPTDDTMYTIGPVLQGQYKWLRAVRAPSSGILYGLPCHANSILRMDPTTDCVTTLPLPPHTNDIANMPWKYHGGNVCPLDGCIYLIPQSAPHVLKLDPRTDELSFVGMELPGKYKWYGGLVGHDGAIYGIPQNSSGVLRIDPSNPVDQIVTVHGNLGEGGHKWHGGSVAGNGVIVGIPAHANSVLLIHPGKTPQISQIGGDTTNNNSDNVILQTGRHRNDDKYKFLGAMVGHDGRVYCVPSGSERVLQVDTVRCTMKHVGPNVIDANLEVMHPNKWQNGFTAPDGSMYAIPLNAETILRVKVLPGKKTNNGEEEEDDDVVTLTTFGGPFKGMNKWEGGVTLKNGTTYCMPNDFKAVLKIEPSKIISHDLSTSDTTANDDVMAKQNPVVVLDTSITTTTDSTSVNAITTTDAAVTTDKDFLSVSTTNGEGKPTPYKLGIPTLRSATHRVRYSATKGSQANTAGPKGGKSSKQLNLKLNSTTVFLLPPDVRKETKVVFDTNTYDLRSAVIGLLQSTDSSLVGYWKNNVVPKDKNLLITCHNNNDSSCISTAPPPQHLVLEHFIVPPLSLARTVSGGACEIAQQHLSDCVVSNKHFLSIFDALLVELILPDLKRRIIESSSCIVSSSGTSATTTTMTDDASTRNMTFYYQRPPTLRLQPGPSDSYVKPHSDNEYGHQDGELNFWLPLTDPSLTKTELWCESQPGCCDYHPMHCKYGEICAFFGSFCRHYVPPNKSEYTRISLDFRVGIEGLGFDYEWQMVGTKDDHSRQKVIL